MLNTHRLLLFVHIVAVMMLAIGDVGALVAATRARRFESARTVLTLMSYHAVVIRTQLVPGAIGSLLSGLALVWLLGVRLTDLWIAGSLVAWLASLIVGVGLLVPAEARAIREAQRLVDAANDECSSELRGAVGSRLVVLGEWSTVVLLVLMTALMVFKPS